MVFGPWGERPRELGADFTPPSFMEMLSNDELRPADSSDQFVYLNRLRTRNE